MYNDSRCKINDKMNIVKTILLRWKESIVLTDENKEKLFQCIATVIDVDCKNNKPVKFTTPTLVKRAIEFSPNSVYTLYMKTCDEVFKFISMLLNEDKSSSGNNLHPCSNSSHRRSLNSGVLSKYIFENPLFSLIL